MLTDEDKQVLHYLRQSPRDPLKKQAADLIEKLSAEVDRLVSSCLQQGMVNASLSRKIDSTGKLRPSTFSFLFRRSK